MGEYYTWINIDKREYLEPFDFDYGGKFHESGHRTNEMMEALYNLLSSDWKNCRIGWIGDECSVPQDIHSDFFDVLNSVAKVLKKYDKTTISVNGYTDSTGTRATNMKLSYNRANTVAKYLQSQGVSAQRFSINGYGPDYPVASNKTASGRAQNRRVEIKLIPTEAE